MNNILGLLEKEFISLEELEEIEASEDVTNIEFNGVSGKDGCSKWYSVYLMDNSDHQVYIK